MRYAPLRLICASDICCGSIWLTEAITLRKGSIVCLLALSCSESRGSQAELSASRSEIVGCSPRRLADDQSLKESWKSFVRL